jgi:hypothetical protein
MDQITSLFAQKAIRQPDDRLDKHGKPELTGVDPMAPVDPTIVVAVADYDDIFERVAREDPSGAGSPLRVRESMRCEDYGAFGLRGTSALNLPGSCKRAERYARVLTSGTSCVVEETDAGVYTPLHRDGYRWSSGLRPLSTTS